MSESIELMPEFDCVDLVVYYFSGFYLTLVICNFFNHDYYKALMAESKS